MIDDRLENALAEELAAYQEKLERGECEPSSSAQAASGEPLPAELQQEFENQKRCLDLLHAIRQLRRPEIGLAGQGGQIDTRHDGRFQILDELGSGGFGIVWRARDPVTGRIVALKVPRPEVLTSAELRKRFEQEAEAAARLDHPNIVPILEAGTDGMVPYIVSTYYEGPTLAEWLSDHEGRVVPRQAALIALALAKALTHAHERGVLHRDVKPSNVLLAPVVGGEPRELPFEPKLMDFGLAKLGERDQELTRTGAMLGTLKYMSPEQAAGRAKEITAATDVYGLGVVLYELLSGATPFAAESDWLTLRQVLEEEPRSLSAVRRDVPRDLAVIVQKCLNKIPGQRYRGARELAEDLERYLAGKSIVARSVPTAERLVKWCRRNPAWAALLGVVTLSMVSGVAFLSYSNVRIAAALAAEQRSREQLTLRLYASDMQRAHEAIQQSNPRHAREILQAYRVRSGEDDLREFAWHFLWRQIPQQLPFVPQHSGPVYSVSLSPVGRLLATACEDGKARVWDVGRQQLKHEFDCSSEVNEVAFSPDGRWLGAACEDGFVRVWDAGSGKLRHALPIGGVITKEVFGASDKVRSIAVQGTGGIVVAGSGKGRNFHALVGRYTANGRIDTSFNNVGDAILWRTEGVEDVGSVVLEPDGRIVVCGLVDGSRMGVARLLPDGTLDNTFGEVGELVLDLGFPKQVALAMVRQPDRCYVLGGYAKRDDYHCTTLIRLLPNGQYDESFGTCGVQLTKLGKYDDIIQSLALQPDGKIIAVGTTSLRHEPESNAIAILRFLPDGQLDPSFAAEGILTLRIAEKNNVATCVAVQADGRILIGGAADRPDGRQAIAVRLNSDGSTDGSFGLEGTLAINFERPEAVINALILQPDGRILLGGGAGGSASVAAVARVDPDGSLDRSFGVDGTALFSIGNRAELLALALYADGRIMAGGSAWCGKASDAASNFLLARFHPDGSLDRSFSANGAQGVAFSPDSKQILSFAEQCIRGWDVEQGAVVAETYVSDFAVEQLGFTAHTGELLSLSGRLVEIWNHQDLSAPRYSRRFTHELSTCLQLPTKSEMVFGWANGELEVYDRDRDEARLQLNPKITGRARVIRLSPDHTRVVSVYGNTLQIYRTSDWRQIAEIATSARVFDVAFLPDAQSLLTSNVEGSVTQWKLPTDGTFAMGDAARPLDSGTSRIYRFAVSQDETQIACGHVDGVVRVLDSHSGRVLFEATPRASEVRGIDFANVAGDLILGYMSGEILLVRREDGAVREHISLGRPIKLMVLSADKKRVAVSYDDGPEVCVLSWPTGKKMVDIPHRGGASCMAIADEQLIVAGGGYLEVFNISTGKLLGGDSQLGASFDHVQVFPGEPLIAVAEGQNGIAIRELPSCRVRHRLLADRKGVAHVAVSADGRNLASVGADNILRIWDTRSWDTLLLLDGQIENGAPDDLRFTRDGRRLFGFHGKTAVVWEAN